MANLKVRNEKKDDDDKDDEDDDDDDDADNNLEAVERAIVLDKEVLLLAYREVVTKLEKNYHDDDHGSDVHDDHGHVNHDDDHHHGLVNHDSDDGHGHVNHYDKYSQ